MRGTVSSATAGAGATGWSWRVIGGPAAGGSSARAGSPPSGRARRELNKALVGRDEGTLGGAAARYRLGEYLAEWLGGRLRPTSSPPRTPGTDGRWPI